MHVATNAGNARLTSLKAVEIAQEGLWLPLRPLRLVAGRDSRIHAVDVDQFRHAITLGLGRAILCLRRCRSPEYAPALEHVCLHNTAYDPQCEGSRAAYVYEAVQLYGVPERFADLTEKGLLEVVEYWDAVHLFDMSVRFARDGHAGTRRALYERFNRLVPPEPFLGADEIVRLDGEKGLLHVLDRMGGYLAQHPDFWVDDWLLRLAEEELGPEAMSEARNAAATHTNIRLYFDAVEATRQRQQQPRSPNYRHFTYPELRDRVIYRTDGGVQRGWLMGWGRHAADDALRDAAADVLRETDPRRLAAYLWIFSRRPYPLDPSRLIDLAGHPDDSVACAARRALQHVTHPAVRKLALDLIASDDASAAGVRMLTNNFHAGDERLIEHALNGEQNEDRLEDLAHAAIEVYRASANGDPLPSMLRVYEGCRCSLARADAVEVLMKRRIAPTWMLEECRHDSYEGTRQAVEAYSGESVKEEY